MRNTIDIIADAKEGKIPTHEECYWALLVLAGLNHFYRKDLESIQETLYSDKKPEMKEVLMGLRLQKDKTILSGYLLAVKKPPAEWLGDSGNPFHPDTKKFMDMGKKIIANAEKKLKNDKG